MIKCLPEFEYFYCILENKRDFISKIRRSKVTDYAALRLFHDSTAKEIHSCISTPGQYCVLSYPFMDSSE